MKEGWEYKKLDTCCEVEYGTRVVQKKDGGTIYPVYGGGGETFRMDRYNREDSIVVSRFAMSKTCVRFVQGKFFLNDSGLSVKAGEGILQGYLNHHLFFLNDSIYNLGKGAAQKNLEVKAFKQMILAIPPLSEQQSIVAELDKINEIIDLKKAQLKDLDLLAQSIFYEMFGDPIENSKGWEVKKLGEVCQVKGGKRIPKGMGFSDTKTSHPYLRVVDMKNGSILKNDTKYITEEVFEKIKRYTISSDDVYITIAGTIGSAGTIPDEFNNANLTENAAKLVFDKGILNKQYLSLYMNASYVQSEIAKRTMAVGVPKLAIFRIEELPLILPPLSLQQSFASKIQAIESQKSAIKQSLADVETLLASRMDYYFN